MTSRRTWRCPDEAMLAAYADQRDAPDARRKLQGHLADCDYCRGQVAFLVRVEEQPPVEAPAGLIARAKLIAERPQRAGRWGFQWGAVAAAAACLLVAANLWVGRQQPEAPRMVAPAPKTPAPETAPAPTTAPPRRTVRGGPLAATPETVFPPPDSTIARQDLEFRWKEVSGSLFYEVRMVTADGDVVWEGKSTGTTLRVPASVPLAAGQKYFVWIAAHLSEGKTVQSRASAFTIKNE